MSYLPSHFNPNYETNIDTLTNAESHLIADLRKVQDRLAELRGMTEMQQLALYLFSHDRNKDEAWYYEIVDGVDQWDRSAHANYLRKARYLLEGVKLDLETAKKVVVNIK